ncbi:hypothetical protein ERJ75_000057900 [Trypanosoma vivax]|nr:hypothetical protein ERJ75_000057900 [Trypanosoma vivax]
MAYDVSTTPPFILFKKPLFRFPAGLGTQQGGNASTRSHPRVYVDEVANDVVIISADSHEVHFYHMLLRDTPADSEEGTHARNTASLWEGGGRESKPQQQAPSLDGTIALKMVPTRSDGKPASIRHAKRCPAPVSTHDSGSAYLVALSLDNSAVLFFLCPSQAGEEPLQVREFAKFKCAPNTLRFREEFYPISSFYWTGPLQDDIPPSDHGRARHREPSPPSVVVSSLWYEELGGNFPRHSGLGDPWCPPSCRVLLCVTSISIDVVKVQCGGAGEDSLVLLCRYPTHTDYWHYCSPARAILSVNKLKPCSVKVLLVTSDVGLYRLPPLWLEENQMIATEDEQDPLPSLVPFAACMDPPATRYPLALLELYHQLFVCSMSRHAQGAVLFRYHLPPKVVNALQMHALSHTQCYVSTLCWILNVIPLCCR